jgi:hypothetical protein
MAAQLFEAPASHGTQASPESEFEDEFEWEGAAGEFEDEAAAYSGEFEGSGEFEHLYSGELEGSGEFEDEYEGEDEYESEASGEYEYEFEGAGEFEASGEYEDEYEYEDEADPFSFGGFGKILKSVANVAAPIAKKLAPMAAQAVFGSIPGIGGIAGPLAGKLTSSLLNEATAEVGELEAAVFGRGQALGEVANTEFAHEAALTEVLAAQAAEASGEGEAEANLAASLPITITIMGARRSTRRVAPVLAHATARLSKALRRRGGPAGRNLLRTVPLIQRRTIATLKAAARRGHKITAPLALRAMATQTQRVLSNPRSVKRAITRNIALRRKVAPPHSHRGLGGRMCARCLGRSRVGRARVV